ncbi:hypothetical protein [Vibrio sp. TBV020]|uniref:hypothetical protein n=1 Tax=Vibrio sp. TBV020 TaxID=3137398 RepID=UPI0038CD8401
MLYKTILLCTLSVTSLHLHAETALQQHLRKEMLLAYDNLDIQLGKCLDVRNNNVIDADRFKDSYLEQLPEKKRGLAILRLSNLALDKCTEKERADYALTLLKYTAESANTTYLDKWLTLEKVYRASDTKQDFDTLDFMKLKQLSSQPPFDKPFDALQVFELYRSDVENK